jgi:hypothetical protein
MELALLGLSLVANLVLLYLLEKPQIQTSFNKLEKTVLTELADLKTKLDGTKTVVSADVANIKQAVVVAQGQVASVEKIVTDTVAAVGTAVQTGVDEAKKSV